MTHGFLLLEEMTVTAICRGSKRKCNSNLREILIVLLILFGVLLIVTYKDAWTEILEQTYSSSYPTHLIPSNGSWQKVNCVSHKCYVYSAFYDSRKAVDAIRIIGTTKRIDSEPVFCRMWYKTKNSHHFYPMTVEAETIIIHEHHKYEYSACFFVCLISPGYPPPPQVSVVTNDYDSPENLLTVISNPRKNRREELAVCVQPINYRQSKFSRLLEFVELHKILGVQHFMFYNHSISPKDDCLLRYYINEGTVTMLPWQIDLVFQSEVHVGNMLATLNDCLYRSMYRYSYVLMIDFDEFIIPNNSTYYTLPELIKALSRRNPNNSIGAYSFQNCFFAIHPHDFNQFALCKNQLTKNLLTQTRIRRTNDFFQHTIRSKYIARPEYVIEAGIHRVWQFFRGYKTLDVPHEVAFLHHYRVLCYAELEQCWKNYSIIDETALRYKDALSKRVESVFDRIEGVCAL